MIHSCANGTSAIAIAAAAEIIELIEGRRLGSGAEHVGSTAVPNLVDGTGTGSIYAQGALRADREGWVAQARLTSLANVHSGHREPGPFGAAAETPTSQRSKMRPGSILVATRRVPWAQPRY